MRVRVGWKVPHCLRHFCPNSAKRRKPWHPLPRPLPQSFPMASGGHLCPPIHPCRHAALSPGPLVCSVSPSPPFPPTHGRATSSRPLSAEEWAVAKGRRRRRRAPHPRADQQSTPHQRWEMAQAKVPELEKKRGEGSQGQRGGWPKELQRKLGAPTASSPGPLSATETPPLHANLPYVWVSASSGSQYGGQREPRKQTGNGVPQGRSFWETHMSTPPPMQQHLDCS